MGDPAVARLRKELLEISRDSSVSGVSAAPVGEDMSHFAGSIKGPAGTPYEGGVFAVDIVIPKDYPFVPPKMKFTTKLWHPNVSSQTGAICLDILKNEWSPALTIKTALLSLCALLSAPEPKDPQDAQVASQYLKDYKGWEAQARSWTQMYAMPAGSSASSTSCSNGTSSSSSSSNSSASSTIGGSSSSGAIPAGIDPAKLRSLEEMGFERSRAIAALRAKGGHLEMAAEWLLTGAG